MGDAIRDCLQDSTKSSLKDILGEPPEIVVPTLPVQELGTKTQWTTLTNPFTINARGIDPDNVSQRISGTLGTWNDSEANRIFQGAGGVTCRIVAIYSNSFDTNVVFAIVNHDDDTSDPGDLAHFTTAVFTNEGTGTSVTLTRASASSNLVTRSGMQVRTYTQAIAGGYANFAAGTGTNSEVDVT